MLPTATFPKFTLLGFAVSAPADWPVPDNAILSGESEASETMLTDPVAAPATVGANVVVKETL